MSLVSLPIHAQQQMLFPQNERVLSKSSWTETRRTATWSPLSTLDARGAFLVVALRALWIRLHIFENHLGRLNKQGIEYLVGKIRSSNRDPPCPCSGNLRLTQGYLKGFTVRHLSNCVPQQSYPRQELICAGLHELASNNKKLAEYWFFN